MNINSNKLAEMEKELIGYLQKNDYSKDTIKKFHTVFAHIRKIVHQAHPVTYEDVLNRYKEEHAAKNYIFFNSMLTTIRYFDSNGEYPAKKCHLIGRGETCYEKLSDEFRMVIDTYREHDLARGKQKTTVYVESFSGMTFLLQMQKQGITSLDDITEDAALSAFRDEEGHINKSCTYKKNAKAVFKGCLESETFNPERIRQIVSFLPKLKGVRKNLQYLTADEFRILESCLLATESPLCLRDKAIGLLALYTGLRSCDIMGLRMDSIDWNNDVIMITQQKTSMPWNLELPTVVGNAIFDYIENDRPQTEVIEIFLSLRHPYGRMQASSSTNIARLIMKTCGIRKNQGDSMGFHLFRHHLATKLLSNNVSLPVISKILGHSSPKSTETYLYADMVHLKECGLSIEAFPIGLEVLR